MLYVKEIIDHKIGDRTPFKKVADQMGWSLAIDESETEKAYNGDLYVKGYAPKKPDNVIKQERIDELKSLLSGADYWGQKYIDGEYTAEEWEQKKAQRMAWRAEIRQLEAEIEKTGQNSTYSSV